MTISKNRTIATAIAMFLTLTMAITLVALPAANAHDPPWTIPTYAYIQVNPNPVGVGQTAYLSFWLDKVPPTAIFYYGMMWHNFKVTVTTPSGDTDILGPFSSDAVGGAWTQYTPTEEGTYTFEFTFPGQTVVLEHEYPFTPLPPGLLPTYDFINDTYEASSATTTLTVQKEPVETAFPDSPLPTQYWTRPINSMNREWYPIGGNWLGLAATTFGQTGLYDQNGNFNPYTTAPNSAHVLWTKPEAFGGQIGGEFGSDERSLYSTGTAYETKFGPVILYGILYYTEYPGAGNNPGPLTAVDLRTGETLWTLDAPAPLRCGMIYKFDSGDQYGAHSYIFCENGRQGLFYPVDVNWYMYEAMTGDLILTIDNATSGTLVRGENGEILSYRLSGNQLSLWNVSKCIELQSQKDPNWLYTSYSPAEIWRPELGAMIDWSPGIEWSVPIATNISGVPIDPLYPLGIRKISDDVILVAAEDTSTPGRSQSGYRIEAGYSAVDGHLVWGPINRTLTPFTNLPITAAGEGVYVVWDQQEQTWTGYDITTGTKLWGPTQPFNSSWAYYDFNGKGVIGYGNLYSWSLGGEAHCYDIKTGAEKWSWYAGNAGIDSPYGSWPLGVFGQYVLADGKLYLAAGHDYTPPVFKGAKLYCLNATTGEEIWSSLFYSMTSSPACADGILVKLNGYDNQIYAYGKGLSATTVEAPMTAITLGDSLVVRGTVTDQSPGQTCLGIPAAGTPAIADEYMSAWMEYLYQQQPKPQDATGVTVKLETLDPNGNYYDIGTVTSDASGMYKLMWEPPVPGEYTIIATFQGSESYYASSAETAFGVTEASPTPAPSEPLTLPPTGIYITGATIAIIVAIAIAILILRKR